MHSQCLLSSGHCAKVRLRSMSQGFSLANGLTYSKSVIARQLDNDTGLASLSYGHVRRGLEKLSRENSSDLAYDLTCWPMGVLDVRARVIPILTLDNQYARWQVSTPNQWGYMQVWRIDTMGMPIDDFRLQYSVIVRHQILIPRSIGWSCLVSAE